LCDVILNDVGTHFGPFFRHVLSYWERRKEANILVVSYEEMQKDIAGVIRKVAAFLDIPVCEEDVVTLAEHLSFQNMKKNPSTNFDADLKVMFSFT